MYIVTGESFAVLHLLALRTTPTKLAKANGPVLAAGTHQQVATLAADNQSLQDKLTQHLEAAQTSSATAQLELSALRDRATQAEAALTDAQTKIQQLGGEAEQAKQGKAQAEQQAGELKAVEGQLEVEVTRLQHQLEGVQGHLQV